MDDKKNETRKVKSLADYPVWMYQSLWSKIISKVKPGSLQLLMNRKRQGKKILQSLFYLAQLKHWVTYLKIPGRWSQQAKKFFAENNPLRKWFVSIPMVDVQTFVVKNGWTVLRKFSKRIMSFIFQYCSAYF